MPGDAHNPARRGIPASCLAAAFALAALAAQLPGIDDSIPVADAAEYVQYPYRVIAGDLPYRDFFMFYPPGHLIVPSAVYALGGPSILHLRLALVILTALVAAVAALAWLPRPATAAAALVVFFPLLGGMNHEALLAWLSIGAAVALLRRWLSAPSLPAACGIGLAAGVATTLRVEHLAALGLAVPLVMLLGYPAASDRRRWPGMPSVIAFLAGLALPVLACIVWALGAGVWAPMWRDLTTVSARHLSQVSLPLFPDLRGHPEPLAVALQLPGFLAPFVLVPVCLIAHLRASHRRDRPGNTSLSLSLFWLTFGTLHVIRGFTRADLVHILEASLPLTVAAAFVIADLRRPAAARPSRAFGMALAVFVIVPYAFTTLALNAPHWRRPAPTERASVDSPAAEGIRIPIGQAAALNDLLAFIRAHTAPTEPIFVTPFDAPPLYLLLGRHAPTRYDSLLPGFVDRDDEALLVRNLEEAGVRCIIHRPGWGIDGRPDRQFENFAPVLNHYLSTHFTPAFESAGLTVLLRRPPPP